MEDRLIVDGKDLTAPQRAAVLGADPVTGEVEALPAVVASLVERGVARRYGATGRHYLTEAGRALRASREQAEHPSRSSEQGGAVFTARLGDEVTGADSAFAPESRRAEVAAAWAGVLEMRRLEDTSGRPCFWERAQPVRAVALALEAADVTPTARDAAGHWTQVGYRALPGESAAVRVEWRGPASSKARLEAERELGRCAAVLAAAGWEALQYLGRQGVRFLQIHPMGIAL